MDSPRSIQAVLYSARGDIGKTLKRVDFLRRIHAVVTSTLPDEMAAQVHTASFNGTRLRIHVANGTAATRLRYAQKQVARELARQRRQYVQDIEIAVRPDEFSQTPASKKPRHLSSSTRAHMSAVASSIEHPPLAAALDNLATAGRETDNG